MASRRNLAEEEEFVHFLESFLNCCIVYVPLKLVARMLSLACPVFQEEGQMSVLGACVLLRACGGSHFVQNRRVEEKRSKHVTGHGPKHVIFGRRRQRKHGE